MKTIAWDVDDVLNDLMGNWFRLCFLLEQPACSVRYDDLKENPPDRLLSISRKEYLASLDGFRLSKRFAQMQPNPEVLDWFQKYGDRYRHIALTSVPQLAAHVSAEWVMRNFSPWIRGFHFVPSARSGDDSPIYDKDKGECLSWLGGVDLLVDDSPANIAAARAAGVPGLLFPRPWNGAEKKVTDLLAELSCF